MEINNADFDNFFEFISIGSESNTDLMAVQIEYTLPTTVYEHDYLNIPAAAFVPYSDDVGFFSYGDLGGKYGSNPQRPF